MGNSRCECHIRGIFNRAVAPSSLVAVFVLGVLGVVDDEVGTFQELDVALVARMLKDLGRWMPEGFVVRYIHHRYAIVGEAIGNCGGGMIQVLRCDQDITDTKGGLFEFGVPNMAA